MTAQETALEIIRLAAPHPNYPLRFQGGQGDPYAVERDDANREIVVFTRTY